MTQRSLFLCTAALVLSGCGSTAENPSPPAATPTAKPAQSKPSTTADERALRRYVKDGFGGGLAGPGSEADWYDDIKSIRIEGKTALVDTDYFKDADVTAFSRYMCVAVAGAGRPGSPLEGKLDVIAVLDQRGAPLTECGPATPPE